MFSNQIMHSIFENVNKSSWIKKKKHSWFFAREKWLNNKPIGVKCKALKDLEKGMTNKDVAAKYGVPQKHSFYVGEK